MLKSIDGKHKKAISPVIAGIMLIAVALIAGLMVSTWSSTLVTKQTEKSPMCTLTTYYSIESAKYNLASGIIRAKITNRGKDDLYNFTIEADNGTIITITPISPSSTYKLKQGRSIYLKGYKSNLGKLNLIRVTPQSCPQKIAQLKVNNIDLTGSLVLNLHLDSVNTTNWTQDDSGNNNHGQLMNGSSSCYNQSGCINLTSGKYGNALEFDGIGDYVDAGNDTSLNITGNEITLEVWAYKSGQQSGSYGGFISKTQYTQSGYYIGWYSGYARFGIANSNDNQVVTSSQQIIPTATWFHYVGVADGNKIRIYIDGIEKYNTAQTVDIGVSNYPVQIGRLYSNLNDFWTNGTIDEVRIWNRALTADEIIELAS